MLLPLESEMFHFLAIIKRGVSDTLTAVRRTDLISVRSFVPPFVTRVLLWSRGYLYLAHKRESEYSDLLKKHRPFFPSLGPFRLLEMKPQWFQRSLQSTGFTPPISTRLKPHEAFFIDQYRETAQPYC